MHRVTIIDSHAGGEPTRVIVAGGPALGGGSLAQRGEKFQRECELFRSAVVNELRGADARIGALLVEPEDQTCAAGVIFFNQAGCLGMCGHGMMGLIVTLAHLGKIAPGDHKIETPAGILAATLHPNGEVTVANVPSWRAKKDFTVEVPGVGQVTGDIVWSGNWFFLIEQHGLELTPANAGRLTDYCRRIRQGLALEGFSAVDHIELFDLPTGPGAHARNFVLCAGRAYYRSPCGTGTSAKLACLAADGKLAEGAEWMQESLIGSTFSGKYYWLDLAAEKISPFITSAAFVTAEATLLLDENDPLCWGIRI